MRLLRSCLLIACGLAAAACTDASSPEITALGFAGTLNGIPWPADTSVSVAFASLTDTTVLISGVRHVAADSSQEVTLVLHGLKAGQFTLGDSTNYAFAEFAYLQSHDPGPSSQTIYRSLAIRPGSVRISAIDRTDSTIAGSFAFEAAPSPDALLHPFLAGHFKVRFRVQQVYTVAPRRQLGE